MQVFRGRILWNRKGVGKIILKVAALYFIHMTRLPALSIYLYNSWGEDIMNYIYLHIYLDWKSQTFWQSNLIDWFDRIGIANNGLLD